MRVINPPILLRLDLIVVRVSKGNGFFLILDAFCVSSFD